MQKHDLTLQTIIEIFEKMGEKKKIEKAQKYFMIVWARAQFLKFLRSRSHVWKKAALSLALTTWQARAQSAAQMSGAHQSFGNSQGFQLELLGCV